MEIIISSAVDFVIDYKELAREHKEYTGQQITDSRRRFFEVVLPYMVMAYRDGKEGRSLTDVFPFIKMKG